MSAGCGHHVDTTEITRSLKRVLWAVLIINAAMFVVEISAGVFSGSVAKEATSQAPADVARFRQGGPPSPRARGTRMDQDRPQRLFRGDAGSTGSFCRPARSC